MKISRPQFIAECRSWVASVGSGYTNEVGSKGYVRFWDVRPTRRQVSQFFKSAKVKFNELV